MSAYDRLYYLRKRLKYALRLQWPAIEYIGPGMWRVKKLKRFRQYKPEYINGEPDRTEYYTI